MDIKTIFNKKYTKGFTLIELLVVIAIIGLLSTIIAAPIQNARKKAKDAKKVSELNAVQLALEQYAEANSNNYPASLSVLSPTYMPILPSWATTNAPVRDRFAYVTYSASPDGGTVMTFGYHLAVHLDVFSEALNNDRDCSLAQTGVNLSGTNCVFFNTSNSITYSYPAYSSGMIGGTGVTTATDILLTTDGATTTCTTVNDCVYDVTNQL